MPSYLIYTIYCLVIMITTGRKCLNVPLVFLFLSGVASLISLVVCAQGEEQPRLNVMLCESVVAVYLSLLIHGLGTHSSNELFRLAAHPLNNRMWAAVFGGGAKLIIKPKRPPEIAPGELSQKHLYHGQDSLKPCSKICITDFPSEMFLQLLNVSVVLDRRDAS